MFYFEEVEELETKSPRRLRLGDFIFLTSKNDVKKITSTVVEVIFLTLYLFLIPNS